MEGFEVKLPDSAKVYLFDISFFDKEKGEWNDELKIRAKRITNEKFIYFDEFNDFYVSKFFDEHPDGFNCDVIITFYDIKLKEACYKKSYNNYWLYIEEINDLNQEDKGKLIRVVDMQQYKRNKQHSW